jgi:uncharacterized protein YjiK
MKKICFLIFFLITIFTSFDQPDKKSVETVTGIGYKLSAPDRVYFLPEALQEISGLTEIDSSKIACIQDENEIVFIYDLSTGKIISRIDCGYSGDYEGIARVDSTLYILRSDGVLIEIKNFKSDKFIRSTYPTGIAWKDNEGLCYNPSNNNLLIAPKEIPHKGSEDKDKRFIYGFSLASKALIQEPVFTIDLSAIENFASENHIKVPMHDKKKSKKNDPDIEFRISAIEIHPITGRLFLLSSVDKLLFVMNTDNEIEYMQRLKSGLFDQPEGITFMKNGDMYISNEGKKNSPTLVRFNYRPITVDPPIK